jgi:hypothetical protein
MVLASIGLPGLAAFEARAELVELAIGGPIGIIVLLGTLTPLAYYGRLVAVGVTRPSGGAAGERQAWRPVVEAIDVTDLPGWSRRTWDANRTLSATVVTILLGLLALAMSAGAFDAVGSAAGLPPTVQDVSESFGPGEPVGSEPPEGSPGPGASDEFGPSEEPAGSGPSFEPVATPVDSPSSSGPPEEAPTSSGTPEAPAPSS